MPVGVCPVCGEKRYLGCETGICFDCEFKQSHDDYVEIAEAVEQFLEEDGALAQEVAGSRPAGPTNTKGGKEMQVRRGICKECGREMSIKAQGLCGACYEKKRREKSKAAPQKDVLTISFEHYPDLLQALTRKAVEDFRPLEMEVLWLLKQSLEKETV